MEKMNDENQRMFDAYVTLDFLYWDIYRMGMRCSGDNDEVYKSFMGICKEIVSTQERLKAVLALNGIYVKVETDEGPTRIHAYYDNDNEVDVAEEGIDDYRW